MILTKFIQRLKAYYNAPKKYTVQFKIEIGTYYEYFTFEVHARKKSDAIKLSAPMLQEKILITVQGIKSNGRTVKF